MRSTSDQAGFLQSRAGRNFQIFALLCAVVSFVVGLEMHRSNVRWFEASKAEEKATAIQLVETMVTAYTDYRAQFLTPEAPVPATFRAHAINRFNAGRDPAESMRLLWVGVPGREINTAPTDRDMVDLVREAAASAEPRLLTRRIERDGALFLRTIYPSVARQQACVDCHNRHAKDGQTWKINDVMGAFALDTPIGPFLAQSRRDALLVGSALFLASCLMGLYFFLLRFGRMASEVEHRAHQRLTAAIENMRDGFALYDRNRRLVLSNGAHRARAAEFGAAPAPAGGAAGRSEPAELRLSDGAWLRVSEAETGHGDTVRIESDITGQKQRELDLRNARDAAERANRAKSEFLAMMSHELRTPLNAINGFSEVIRRGMFGPVSDRYKTYAGDIHNSGQHLLGVINDILDMAKVEAGKVELAETEFFAAALIRDCRQLLRERAAAAGLKLTAGPVADARLRGDPLRLKQVLLNLVANAIKFTAPGGRIDVAAGPAADGTYVFSVADTGVGIAAVDIPKALAPFGQIDNQMTRKQGGTGLGLPLSKALIELHGGTLTLVSEPGRGTTVTCALPADRVMANDIGAAAE